MLCSMHSTCSTGSKFQPVSKLHSYTLLLKPPVFMRSVMCLIWSHSQAPPSFAGTWKYDLMVLSLHSIGSTWLVDQLHINLVPWGSTVMNDVNVCVSLTLDSPFSTTETIMCSATGWVHWAVQGTLWDIEEKKANKLVGHLSQADYRLCSNLVVRIVHGSYVVHITDTLQWYAVMYTWLYHARFIL